MIQSRNPTYFIFQAFLKAWDFVCSRETENVKLIVPENQTFLLHPVTFRGPCKAKEIDQVSGMGNKKFTFRNLFFYLFILVDTLDY